MPFRHPLSNPAARTHHLDFRPERLEPRFALAVTWSAGTWTISGDVDPATPADTIVVSRDPDDAGRLQAVVNGVVVDTRRENAVRVIRVCGGRGDDSITVDIPGNTRIKARLFGGSGHDTLLGGEGRDRIRGGKGHDDINGGGGDDALHGGDGDDSLVGAAGDDSLRGESGDDTLRGGSGRNRLAGGSGRDTFFAALGVDQVLRTDDETLIGNETTNPLRVSADSGELEAWYVDAALAQWGSDLGREALPRWRWSAGVDGGPEGEGVSTLAQAGTDPNQTGDSSGTNNQVAGVDEGDLVKTDGRHLFVLAGDGVDIVQAWPADELVVVGHVATPGGEAAVFLHGSRLTVISQESGAEPLVEATEGDAARIASWSPSWQPQTIVTVIDVSVPAAPTILETTRLDGWLVDARALDGRVLVVTQDSLDIPEPALIAVPAGGQPAMAAGTVSGGAAILPLGPAVVLEGTDDDDTRYVYETEAAYRERLAQAWATTARPRFSVSSPTGTASGELLVPGSTYLPLQAGAADVLSLVSFETGDDVAGPEAVTSVAGGAGEIYASASSLYVAATHWGSWWDVTDTETTTNIYAFDIRQPDTPLVAMGSVPGMTLDQFSLDESDAGLLRVATTSGFGATASSGVFILAAAFGNLQTIGSVTGLAAGERIFSARFVGDVGYVSTFREVDPLFVIDLADPTAPRVVGELKVPGFSTYLHPVDASHLLGVGRDVDAATGRVLGLQLSIFDVGDPAAPERTATYTFPGDGWDSWSEALWDHHALSWFADHGILTLPVQQGSWWDGGSGLVVFSIEPHSADGFTKLGEISHDDAVRRSLRIGEFLYSISTGEVQAHRLDDPTTRVGRTALTPAPSDPEWFVGGWAGD